jgi:hypothetical protein
MNPCKALGAQAADAWDMVRTSVCTQPGATVCWRPRHPPKITKHQLFPQIWVYVSQVVVIGLTWMIQLDLDPISGWRVYLTGDLPEADRLVLEDLMATEDSPWSEVWGAWQTDQAKIRRWPYLRPISGVTTTKTKRMGPKGDVPEVKRPRCPKGTRRVGEDCVPRETR